MPKVLNKHTDVIPPDAVYVGRGSPWGNPYKVTSVWTRDMCCEAFEKFILPKLDVTALRGKDLICFCAPKHCHADALLKKANE